MDCPKCSTPMNYIEVRKNVLEYLSHGLPGLSFSTAGLFPAGLQILPLPPLRT